MMKKMEESTETIRNGIEGLKEEMRRKESKWDGERKELRRDWRNWRKKKISIQRM